MSGIKRMLLGIAIMLLAIPFAPLGGSDSIFLGVSVTVSVVGLLCTISGYVKSDRDA